MIIPARKFYIQHLNKFSQYNQSKSWINWYADVAKYKGIRTAKILRKYKGSDAKLLDLGCGIGLSLSVLAQEFPKSNGCDIDKEAIIASKKILKELNINIPVLIYDGKRLPFADKSFDIVTCIEVIEHVQNMELLLREINRVLKPDGILHITTANKWWPYEPHFKLLFLSYLPEKLANLYVRLSGRGQDYKGIKLPSYNQFKKLVSQYFIVEDITLEIITNYKHYEFDKERGIVVVFVGQLLQILQKLNNIILFKYLSFIVHFVLIRISLGWLFIGIPKK